ncbi:MAG: hypothetical protein ABIQ15_17950 [Nocardioides sp.]
MAFTAADVAALVRTRDLIGLGILTPDSQAAMVRTSGRSFARLAAWQVGLIARLAVEGDDPAERLDELLAKVLPHVEHLQDYVWRRHLGSAAGRLLARTGTATPMAVGFVDIVGCTGQSQHLTDKELVDWVEHFEDHLTHTVVEVGGPIIKTIGDDVLGPTVNIAARLTSLARPGTVLVDPVTHD